MLFRIWLLSMLEKKSQRVGRIELPYKKSMIFFPRNKWLSNRHLESCTSRWEFPVRSQRTT